MVRCTKRAARHPRCIRDRSSRRCLDRRRGHRARRLAPSILRVGLPGPLPDPHPSKRYQLAVIATYLAYPGLLQRDPDGRTELLLAASYAWSDDHLALDVALRGARFQNGGPVTAADVVRSLEAFPPVSIRPSTRRGPASPRRS